MVATARRARRLPGVSFEAAAPPSRLVLPRMDVAGFVGFATAGPFDVPVAVEDPTAHAAIFGEDDAPIAWDAERGERATAHLGQAVRAFFANGGRRCWVVRAGRGGETATFHVPGLLQRDGRRQFSRPVLAARSPGTWSDALAVGAALSSTPARVVRASLRLLTADLELPVDAIRPGDLLRLARGEDWAVLVAVRSVRAHDGGTRVEGDRASVVWLDRPPFPDGASCVADAIGEDGIEREVAAVAHAAGRAVELDLDVDAAGAPAPGSIVLVAGLGANAHALAVDAVLPPRASRGGVVARGSLFRLRGAVPRAMRDADPDVADVLAWDAWVRRGEGAMHRLEGLGFAARHPRWPGRLPDDEALFAADPPRDSADAALWREASAPRFPLAGTGMNPRATLFPLAMEVVPRAFSRARPSARSDIARNGILALDERLFLDRALAETRVEAIEEQAEAIRWLAAEPRRLRGLHALFEIDEVTIVAVPDAAHRPWTWVEREPLAPPSARALRPEAHPAGRGFEDCGRRPLRAPVFLSAATDETGRVALAWRPTDAADATYVVAEAADPGFRDAAVVYRGPRTTVELYRRGAAYYRVHAVAGPNSSDWSTPVAVDASPAGRVMVDATRGTPALAAVHRALLRMCAARGDVVAVLSLGEHAREDDAVGHVAALRSSRHDGGTIVPALDASEGRALSFGAVYHPWTVSRGPAAGTLSRVPPDGAVAGVLAGCAATRGAWVAPANEPLRDVVALVRPLARAHHERLYGANVNVVRDEPRGFLVLAQDTLTSDVDLRPLNVRRLLCLLRRLALLHGPSYVFEPNDPVSRRGAQRAFESVLSELHRMGAFAGARAEDAFRVEVGDPPNTSASVDAGRMIVELKVAPSRPLAFLTVRLVNAARGLRVEAA